MFYTVEWRNNTYFIYKKDTEKVVITCDKGLIQIIVKLTAQKILCSFLRWTKHSFEGHKISCIKTISYAYLKMKRLITGTTRFWFMIYEKSVTRCTFLHCGAGMHQKSEQSTKNYARNIAFLSALYFHLN